MRLTEKSQVTVPKHIREHLGIGPGSEVDFEIDGPIVQLVKRASEEDGETRGDRLVRQLREFGRTAQRTGLTSDEIMDMTRGPYNDLDAS